MGYPQGRWAALDLNCPKPAIKVARLKGLGNAIVPQVFMEIMQAIKTVEEVKPAITSKRYKLYCRTGKNTKCRR